MRWKVPGKRCSSGTQKATAQRPSKNSSLRSQKLVKRAKKADSEKAKESEQCLWRKAKEKTKL